MKTAPGVSRELMDVLYDPQTSGGLLMAVRPEAAPALLAELSDRLLCVRIVGRMERAREDCAVFVT